MIPALYRKNRFSAALATYSTTSDSYQTEEPFVLIGGGNDEQTKEVRQLIFKYLAFRTARQAVIDRVAADRAIKQLYNGCTDLGPTPVE